LIWLDVQDTVIFVKKNRSSISVTNPPTELQSVKQITLALSTTYKKLNYYSANHSVYLDSLKPLKKSLEEHTEHFGRIRLHIERDRILYNGEVVHEATSDPTELVSILHRDGILWIEFQPGLELSEIDTLLKVLHDHCVLEEDAEDDIVTALWAFRLPSIAYEVAELELCLDNELTLESLPCRPPDSDERMDISKENRSKSYSELPISWSLPDEAESDCRAELFPLSREEQNQLKKMIAAEEKLDGSDHVVDVLIYILENHSFPEGVDDLVGYLLQAVRDAFRSLRFRYLSTLLDRVKKELDTLLPLSHWAVPSLKLIFLKLSNKSFLDELSAISSRIEDCDVETLHYLKRFLELLDTNAMATLAPMIQQNRSAKFQRLLLEIITKMAKRDFTSFERLIFSDDKAMSVRLVQILKFFNTEHSRKILSKLVCDESAIIRKQALKIIINKNDLSLEEISDLLNDPDDSIRSLLLQHLGREKNDKIEQLLLEYLQSDQAKQNGPEHYMAVCRTLGQCASDGSLPFLENLIFKWPRLGILRSSQSPQRRGAIMALEVLNTKKAVDLLDRDSQGFIKNFLKSP
jgi:hypothetical protein